MGKFEIFLSNLCPPHPIKAFTICLHKPVVKTNKLQLFRHPYTQKGRKKDIKQLNKQFYSKHEPEIWEFVHEAI